MTGETTKAAAAFAMGASAADRLYELITAIAIGRLDEGSRGVSGSTPFKRSQSRPVAYG